jgi:hypothetical protein
MIGSYFPYALLVAALALSLPALLAILSAPGGVGSRGGSVVPASQSAPPARTRQHYPGRILIASPFQRDVMQDDEEDDE